MKTQAYIDTAKDIVSTERENTHGKKKINTDNIAKTWSA